MAHRLPLVPEEPEGYHLSPIPGGEVAETFHVSAGEGGAFTDSENLFTRSDTAPRPWWFGAAVLLLALPIVSHGCHRWDHDDEPAIVPIDQSVRSPESPR